MRAAGMRAAGLLGCSATVPGCLAKCRSGVSGNAGKGSYLAEADAMRGGEVIGGVCVAMADIRGTPSGAWNIAVRTRGVFTHRADFGKPACANRGLVRTANQPESGKLNPFQANAADLRFLPLTHEVNWKYSILPPPI